MKNVIMKRCKYLVGALMLVITILYCSGCNWYVSEVPISNSKKSSIDTSVIGEWGVVEDDTIHFALKINALNDKEYVLSVVDFGEDNKFLDVTNFACHISDVGDDSYVNVRILEGEDAGKYYLARYEIQNDTLRTFVLHEDSLKIGFKSSHELRRFIKRYKGDFRKKFVSAHEVKLLSKE